MSDERPTAPNVQVTHWKPRHPHMSWEQLLVDEAGLPRHMPMGVTEQGEGPEDDAVAHHYVCWCNHPDCPLTTALRLAWEAGQRQGVDDGPSSPVA